MDYTPTQIETIKNAIAKAREAMRQAQRYEALVFARTYIAEDGVQIPGREADKEGCRFVSEQLLLSLESSRPVSEDENVLREIKRANMEARWARLAELDKVIGFHLRLGPAAELEATCRELLNQDHGLGAAVFPKARIVVMPAACDDYVFVPVLEDELEQ
ncbi:MAG: hypothetical protein ACE5LB_12770 [Acidiferrobacterales bacterium]